ncbi:MAG TPA: hypothetical protein PK177_07105 [Burkholderiaceae bacterium]|nr:hypothetical protein [Burkholderiaceae bacterium]
MRFVLPLALGVGVLGSGCATITSDSTQLVRVETFTEEGAEIKGASCRFENENGIFQVTSPGSTMVAKAGGDMMVTCSAAEQPDAKGVVTSRAGAGMFGNIIFGGGIGAIIDHSKGTAYNYPTWLQMVFGKVISFDRQDHKDGEPAPAFVVREGKREAYTRPTTAPLAISATTNPK